jgi:sulfite reductase (ferredoxin)
MRFYDVPDVLFAEQDQFESDIRDFSRGLINPVKFKAIRVAHGVYEQRQNNTYMIRIRCAAGGITPTQLKKVAELAERYGSGEVHFTTRQEVQVHEVLLQDVIKAIRGLNDVGMSSRGGGGNTIRNILTSVDSGIAPDEVFDVDPYAIALTTRMISEPDSWNLPRKFKIAMSNSEKDTTYSMATCLGFVATVKDGKKGFRVNVAGGMGAKPMVGNTLIDFLPEDRVYHVTRAIKTMFDKHGNRRSKFSSRIKFLWKKLGRPDFEKLFLEAYNKIKDRDELKLDLVPLENKANATDLPVEVVEGDRYEKWKSRYVYDQKQSGLKSILIPLHLGDLYKADADLLCDFLRHFGDNTIRCDRNQNIRVRNIPEKYLGNMYNVIQKMTVTLSDYAAFIGNMVNCTGAQTCKLGICLPRGLSDAIRDRLLHSSLDLDRLAGFKMNMSGCPNTCGMHHIADMGFFGKIGRHKEAIYPAYNVLVGATVTPEKTTYAERVNEIPSKCVPDFVHDFFEVFIPKRANYPTFGEYLADGGKDFIHSLCEKYKNAPDFDGDATYFVDWGAKRRLSLDELGTAECSAGLFDMIDVDKKAIQAQKDLIEKTTSERDIQEALYRMLFHASRMLLVTRGLDAKSEKNAFELFAKHFITAGLVSDQYMDVVTLGKLQVLGELPRHKDLIYTLAEDIQTLYSQMDDSLRFPQDRGEASAQPVAEPEPSKTDKVLRDFRGVACPMNFVKTKLVLETMAPGGVLEILLDDGEPIQNVPNSVRLEGHKVLDQKQEGEHWTVTIQKAA